MAVVCLDPDFFMRPKVFEVGRDARELYLVGLCYVARQLTGGFLPQQILRHADIENPTECADLLVKHGLWERAEGGFQVIQDLDGIGAVKWHIYRERTGGQTWKRQRARVFERDKHTCQYCGATGVPLHCDHIIPVYRGGSDRMDNLTTACDKCNMSKGKKHLEEWIA